jgi:CheY-like chemotaxis protein
MQTDERAQVLVVDDSETVRFVLGRILEDHGASVVFAADGDEAGDVLRKGARFTAVFLDLLMPNSSGWDVLELIRQNPGTRETPIFILSGAPVSREEKERLCEKVAGFVDKSDFDLQAFSKWVAAALARDFAGDLTPA